MKKTKETKKTKNSFTYIIVVGAVLLLGNLAIVIWGCPKTKTDWLTFISGWVSGFATLIVGIISYNQSQKYALYTAKNDIKNKINIEKIELINVFNEISAFSLYINFLRNLFEHKEAVYNNLDYQDGLIILRETLSNAAKKFQSLNYIPTNMKVIITKLCDIILEPLYDDIMPKDVNQQASSENLQKIKKLAILWVMQISQIRVDSIREMNDLSEKIGRCESMDDIEKTMNETKIRNELTLKNIADIIEQMTNRKSSFAE